MKKKVTILGILVILFLSCTTNTTTHVPAKHYTVNTSVQHPDWTEDAVIYEVNIRQHTAEGTLEAFEEDLPRLQELGVDIIWLMPIFPIGSLHRKSAKYVLAEELEDPAEQAKYLGSYYAIKDYKSVNPDFGTLRDLKDLVREAHGFRMHVILDIAVNHTAWDHPWITSHPEYYTRVAADSTPWNPEWMAEHPDYYNWIREKEMTYPIDQDGETDWWDTADLNYDNKDLRKEIMEILKYWVEVADIDGYRCDVAGRVPCDFWDEVRPALDSIKPVFMLAEAEREDCLVEKAFDMNYGWELYHIMNQIAAGERDKTALESYYAKMDTLYDPDIYKMNFITNHDENYWQGTIEERMGESAEVFAMLTFTLPGMPLLYSGQEIGLDKRLRFFEKDTIVWEESPWEDVYTDFIELKKDNEVFWNGAFGGNMQVIGMPESNVFAFERTNDDSRFVILANLGDKKQTVQLGDPYAGLEFTDVYTMDEIKPEKDIKLGAWEYLILMED